MNTSHYPSLENCKKLTEIGFPETYITREDESILPPDEIGRYVCPSVMEMLELCPNCVVDNGGYAVKLCRTKR